MADLLNTGMRIRHFRILRGMTQKVLGVAVGFPESSADVRIAQYESGARTPKRELLCQLAAVLGVSPSRLAVPRIKTARSCAAYWPHWRTNAASNYPHDPKMPKQFISLTGKEQRTLKNYEVTITETLQKTVTVEANSREEAERQVEENWNNSEYILDADSFVGVDFAARTNERSREYER